MDSISKRQGKLAEIRKLLIQDYKKHFNKNYKMEIPFIGKRSDVLNKMACVRYFNNQGKKNDNVERAEDLWEKAIHQNNSHYYSIFNLGLKRFLNGEISADACRAEFEDYIFSHPTKGHLC